MVCRSTPFAVGEKICQIVGFLKRHADQINAVHNSSNACPHVDDSPAVIALLDIVKGRVCVHVLMIATASADSN